MFFLWDSCTMAISSRLPLRSASPAKSSQRSVCSLKNAKLMVAALVLFTAVTILVFTCNQVTRKGSKGSPAPAEISGIPAVVGSFVSSLTEKTRHSFRNQEESEMGHEETFENSEVFRAMVKDKTKEDSKTVAAYLNTVRNYLLAFPSPFIKEVPVGNSRPEPSGDKHQQESETPGSSKADPASDRPKPKLLVWYNPPNYLPRKSSKDWFGHCPVSECQLSYSYRRDHAQADAVLFLGGPSTGVPQRGHPKQIFVFFSMESPWLTRRGYSKTVWNSAFNWTWNYRTDSDIFEPVGYLKRAPFVPSHSSLLNVKRQKVKPVAWIASNCNVQSKRGQYVRRLQKVIPVDIYGRCGTISMCPRDNGGDCDKELNEKLNDTYLFYLSFENAMCVDYITEKYYKIFKDVHIVPVVRGGANYSRFFPEGTFVDAEQFPSPEDLGRYLLSLAEDEARYVDLLWRKAHFVYHEHGIVDAFCQLCYKLHHLDRFAKTYSDMYGWYHRDKCRPPRPFLKGKGGKERGRSRR